VIDRRTFWRVVAGGLLTAPLGAEAQQAGTTYKIGYLSPGPVTDQLNPASMFSAFRQGLTELGYVEGLNLVIESRYADGEVGRLSCLAELVRLKVAIIVTWGPGVIPARGATTTIPIVMASTLDAVASGLVDSLARPGGKRRLPKKPCPKCGANVGPMPLRVENLRHLGWEPYTVQPFATSSLSTRAPLAGSSSGGTRRTGSSSFGTLTGRPSGGPVRGHACLGGSMRSSASSHTRVTDRGLLLGGS
jgi:hypothetical protein